MFWLKFYTNILLDLIIKKYFNDHRCLLIFSDSEFDRSTHVPSVRIEIVNESVDSALIFHDYGCQGIVIYSQNPVPIFAEFEAQIKLAMERFNRRRFLIVVDSFKENPEMDLFGLKELNFVSDLLLVLPKNLNQQNSSILDTNNDAISFELKTHRYVGGSTNNEPVFLDTWFSKNQSFQFDMHLYPDKLKNQLERPLKMACITYQPFSIIGHSVEEHHGSELITAVLYALRLNMTPVPIVKEKEYWGEIFPNWTGTGILGSLVQDEADIGFCIHYAYHSQKNGLIILQIAASMTTWEESYHYLDFSKLTVRTGVTCLVPAPKHAARWLTPFYSYSPRLWICVILTFFLSILILSLILFCYNHNTSMVLHPQKAESFPFFVKMATKVVIKPFFQQPLGRNEVPLKLASKFMMGLMLLLGLFLTSSYSSGLATVMTLPRYENAINTVEDFAGSGLEWGATDEAWITSIQHAEDPDCVKIVSQFQTESEEELSKLSKTRNFAFAVERLPFENFAVGGYVGRDVIEKFRLMSEDLYYAHCIMMLRKNSVLLPSLDAFLLQTFETGLISKWQNRAVEIFMDAKVQTVVKFFKHHRLEQEVVRLKWSHVEGAFAALALGHGLSCVVFVVELLKMK